MAAGCLPLTNEIVSLLDELTPAVNGPLNGRKLTPQEEIRVYHFLSELRHFAHYGRDGRCPATMYHGPGHQSRAHCDNPDPFHEAPHTAEAMGMVARWHGLWAFGGHDQENFDQVGGDY